MQSFWRYILFVLFLGVIVVWLAMFNTRYAIFRLIACDVGQGDAILATYGSVQILTDGGLPNGKVVECLSRHMPFWDRTIEIVVNTHPDKDHYGGLIEIVDVYKVENFVVSGLDSSSQEFRVLQNVVQNEGSRVLIVSEGQSIRLGLMQLDILYPSQEAFLGDPTGQAPRDNSNVLGIYTTTKNKNDFSLVTILSFGEFDALLTGDIEDKVSDLVAESFSNKPRTKDQRLIEYLKVPHHGSKNGLSQRLLDAVNPKLAVVSLGKNNSYGHPHEEVLKILSGKVTKIMRTDLEGDIVVESDGEAYWILD